MTLQAMALVLTSLLLSAVAAVAMPTAVTGQCHESGRQSGTQCGGQQSVVATGRDHMLIQFHSSFLHTSTVENIGSGDSIKLTAHTGEKVAVTSPEVSASGIGAEEEQVFVLERFDGVGSTISSGDAVLLKAHTGKYISVNASDVFAKWEHRGAWERLIIQREAGDGVIHSGDSISFLTHTGNYLSVDQAEVVAQWSHSLSWEQFVVQKVAAPTTIPPQPVGPTPTTDFPGDWVAEHAQCDPEMNCYRLHTVSCKSKVGEDLPSSQCDPSTRPPSYEPCHMLGEGICLNIAPTDCVDVPGCWWNRWHLTCGELEHAGACSGESVQLQGFSASDAQMVGRLCPVTCGRCTVEHLIPEHPGTLQCEADACEDDPGFSGNAQFGVVVSSSCSVIQGGDCNSFALAEELKAACPKSCGLC